MGKRSCLGGYLIIPVIAGFIGGLFLWSDQVQAAEAQNVRLVGHSDLQGRESLQGVLKGTYA